MRRRNTLAFVAVFLGVATLSLAAPTGVWQFDQNLNAAVGSNATFVGNAATKCTSGTLSSYGAPALPGGDATVLRFTDTSVNQGIQVPTNMAANGGGTKVNQYTIVADIMFTAYPGGWGTLFNVEDTYASTIWIDASDGSFGGAQPVGGYAPTDIQTNTWYRLATVIDIKSGAMWVYLNGELRGFRDGGAKGTRPINTLDSAMALNPGVSSIINLFTNSDGGYSGEGYINSLAAYDTALTAGEIAALGTPDADGLPTAAPSDPSGLIHHSDLNRAPGTNSLYTGDFTNTYKSSFGWYGTMDYTGTGAIQMNHGAYDWDDPFVELLTTPTLGVADSQSFEFVCDFVPQFNSVANYQVVQFYLTGSNLGYAQAEPQSDVYFMFGSDKNANLWVCFSDDASDESAKIYLPYTPADIDVARVILNYDAGTTTWRAFYRVNTAGSLYQAPAPGGGVTIVKPRTKPAYRIQQDQYYSPTMAAWSLQLNDIQLFDSVKTTGPNLLDGTLFSRRFFNGAPGAGFWDPITVYHDVDSLYWPDPMTHDYTSTGALLVNHLGPTWPGGNSVINLRSTPSQSVELVLDVKPAWPLNGKGQMFNFTFDGGAASIFVFNNGGNSAGWGMYFGAADIFNPLPANVEMPYTPADQVDDLRLIITYDASTTTYSAFYSINGAGVERIGSSFVQARASTAVDLQWQVWDPTNTLPYTVALSDFQEIIGVQTLVGSDVPDWRLY